MNDEVERQVESARQEEKIRKDTAEFFASLGPNDEIVKPIYSPEAFIFRSKAKAAAAAGELQRSGCKHPLHLLRQFEDDDPIIARRGMRVNLFQCAACGELAWLVDAWGNALSDS